MALQLINLGTAPNDGTGDKARVAFGKANSNFQVIGAALDAKQALIDQKAPLISPGFLGAPTAPTPALGTNSDQIATMAAVQAAIGALVNGAPGALDTIKELSDALGGDANFATTIINALALKAPLSSPTFIDEPKGPTPAPGDNSTRLATTAFVALATGGGTPIGGSIEYNGIGTPINTLPENGASYAAASYPALFAALVKSAAATISIASPAVVGWVGHGLEVGFPVKFTTTGALPTGITAGTTYWVIAAGFGADSFRVSATPGGSAVNTTGSQSGIHKAICAPHGCANDLTTFNVPDSRGIFVRGFDALRGVDPARGFGQEQLDAMQGHIHQTPVPNAGGSSYNVGGAGAAGSAQVNSGGPVSDGTNGTPRTATETRPRNNTKRYFIRYQ